MQFDRLKRRDFVGLLLGALMASVPRTGRAQQRVPKIGFLHQGFAEPLLNTNAFKRGLSEAGIDNQAVRIEDRAANGRYDRLPALAAELVADEVEVIAANFLPAALAAKAATETIPVVFLSGSDPIKSGLVSSINRPTGNVTGIAPMFTLLETKNLELLHELVPAASVIGALANLTNPNTEHQLDDLRAAARVLGLHVDQALPVGDGYLVVVGMDLVERQKAVAIAAVFDESGLQARFYPNHLGEVDVALELFLGGRLDVEIF